MDHEILVTDTHIFYKVDLWVTLIYYPKNNISPSSKSSRYEAKSLDHKIQVTDLHILNKVNLSVTLIHYTNYNVHPSNNLENTKQNY